MSQRFDFISDENDRAVLMRVSDLILSAEKWGKPSFSNFLTEHEQAVVLEQFRGRIGDLNYFYGGYEQASRKVFCALPDFFGYSDTQVDYPFKAVTMLIPKGYTVTHRDILGSLMALRIKREAVGDILVGDCLAVVFICEPAASLVVSELTKIGGVGVSCSFGTPEVLPDPYKLEQHNGVLSSMRLDAVVSLVTNLSRSESARLINSGLVMKNAQTVTSASKEVNEQDKISIRGHGKYQIESIGGTTRKGRLHIIYNKYI